MADATTTAAPGGGGLETETIIIIVGSIAGSLFLIVVILLCIVGCFLHKKSNNDDEDDYDERKHKKGKMKDLEEPRDRLFRPIDQWGNPAGPGGGHDIAEIDHILWAETQSRRGSIAMRNPAFEDDIDTEKDEEPRLSNGHALSNGHGPPRPPNIDMLPPIMRQISTKSEDSSKPHNSSGPRTPTSPTQINILNQGTWGTPDGPAEFEPSDGRYQHDDGNHGQRPRSTSHMSTVSGNMDDPQQVDFSVFGSGNMRGSALQENSLRRSFRSGTHAIVDFYESGYSNSIGARSAVSLPMSRMDVEVEETDERPTSGYGTGSKMLWQKRKFVT